MGCGIGDWILKASVRIKIINGTHMNLSDISGTYMNLSCISISSQSHQFICYRHALHCVLLVCMVHVCACADTTLNFKPVPVLQDTPPKCWHGSCRHDRTIVGFHVEVWRNANTERPTVQYGYDALWWVTCLLVGIPGNGSAHGHTTISWVFSKLL